MRKQRNATTHSESLTSTESYDSAQGHERSEAILEPSDQQFLRTALVSSP